MLHEILKAENYRGAICTSKTVFCSYVGDNKRTDRNALVEYCTHCGKQQVYFRKDGRIDDRRYQRNHIRDLIQRDSPLYELIYGKPSDIVYKSSKEEIRSKIREATFDSIRRANRLINRAAV